MLSPAQEVAMATVSVGLVGCGFAAELHMYAYKRVYGVEVEVAAVAARGDHVVDFARKHRIRDRHRDFRALLADGDIDVVDICTPPALHAAMIVAAMQAGKHVLCQKPLARDFLRARDQAPLGPHLAESGLYQRAPS